VDLTRVAGRTARCTAWLTGVVALAVSTQASGAPQDPGTAAEAQFATFLRSFRRALADDDRDALASLTALPFQYESADLDAAAFRRIVPVLFPPAVRNCLAGAQPILEDGRYVIFCTPYGFYFGRVGGEFRLLEFMADGEALEE
jgi:uncharacterized protein (DUF2236 family)